MGRNREFKIRFALCDYIVPVLAIMIIIFPEKTDGENQCGITDV